MISSIRKRLLSLLLIIMLVVLAMIAFGNYYLDKSDVERHLDILLGQAGLAYQVLVGSDIHSRNLVKLQDELNNIPKFSAVYFLNGQGSSKKYEEKFQIQLWDAKTHKLLVHSANAPLAPLSKGNNGFSWVTIDDKKWRVFTWYNPGNQTILNMGERDTVRDEIGNIIARDDMLIALLAFPLIAILIWIIITRSLLPLNTISSEVANRIPSYLEPVRVKNIPEEIKPLVDEINKLLLRLKRAFEREKRFASDAAHELRTPLAALKAQVQLIAATETKTPEFQEQSQRLLRIVDRSTHIIEQLLTLSRIIPESQESFHDFAPVDLHKITSETLTLLVPHALEKSIELALECQQGPVMLNANAIMLGILIRNLVDNAIRYSSENSQVTVTIAKEAQIIRLSVLDTGPGIPPELRSRVFERFYRVLGTNTQGTGLGLAIVQQIASLHQAEVTLGTGPEGHGLLATVILPLDLPTNN